MSKLYNIYLSLKSQEKEENTLYLFKSGIFFICIEEDAKIASNLLHLKLTNLNENIVKCGFPIGSLEKYSNLLKFSNYTFKIIDTFKNEAFSIKNYFVHSNIEDLLIDISNIDTNNLSIREAYDFIDKIKENAIALLNNI